MRQEKHRCVVFWDEVAWVICSIERDLVAQGSSPFEAIVNLKATLVAEREWNQRDKRAGRKPGEYRPSEESAVAAYRKAGVWWRGPLNMRKMYRVNVTG